MTLMSEANLFLATKMIRFTDFSVRRATVVAFTQRVAAFNTSAVLASVLADYATRYDGQVQVLPLPDDVPPEFNRIELASSDAQWHFSASPTRLSSAWHYTSSIADSIERTIGECSSVIERCVEKTEVRVNRLGLVLRRTSPDAEPHRTLIRRFCRPDCFDQDAGTSPLRNSQGFEIHNLKKYLLNQIDINSWVRCKTGVDSSTKDPVILFEQDLNTRTNGDCPFDSESIRDFFARAMTEANQILEIYFPR